MSTIFRYNTTFILHCSLKITMVTNRQVCVISTVLSILVTIICSQSHMHNDILNNYSCVFITCLQFCPQLSVGPRQGSETMAVILEDVDMLSMSISQIMAEVTSKHRIPQVKQMQLLTHLRLAKNFSSFQHRLKCVMARLQAISVLGEKGERGGGGGGERKL